MSYKPKSSRISLTRFYFTFPSSMHSNPLTIFSLSKSRKWATLVTWFLFFLKNFWLYLFLFWRGCSRSVFIRLWPSRFMRFSILFKRRRNSFHNELERKFSFLILLSMWVKGMNFFQLKLKTPDYSSLKILNSYKMNSIKDLFLFKLIMVL